MVLCVAVTSPWMGLLSAFGGTPPDINFEELHPYMKVVGKPDDPKETAEDIKTGWKDFVRAYKEKTDGRRSK